MEMGLEVLHVREATMGDLLEWIRLANSLEMFTTLKKSSGDLYKLTVSSLNSTNKVHIVEADHKTLWEIVNNASYLGLEVEVNEDYHVSLKFKEGLSYGIGGDFSGLD